MEMNDYRMDRKLAAEGAWTEILPGSSWLVGHASMLNPRYVIASQEEWAAHRARNFADDEARRADEHETNIRVAARGLVFDWKPEAVTEDGEPLPPTLENKVRVLRECPEALVELWWQCNRAQSFRAADVVRIVGKSASCSDGPAESAQMPSGSSS